MSATRYPDFLPWAETRRIAAVLRAARVKSGMRQVDVAEKTGWSKAKVGHAERAAVRMRAADALEFAKVLGVTLTGLEGAER
jgi:transcriptional regulator with XRE-family HTH domain